MKKIYLLASLLATSLLTYAQQGPNPSLPETRTKVVRGCEYEVIPGLAQVTQIQVKRPAAESLLEYDEYDVQFIFIPMDGHSVIDAVKEQELSFMLRSGATPIPVGPAYIQKKGVKVGTKYAMNLLQTKNAKACLEQYTYESKALNNDLSEAENRIIPYVKSAYKAPVFVSNNVADTTTTIALVPTPVASIETDLPENLADMTEDEMRAYVANKIKHQPVTPSANEINIDSLKAVIKNNLYNKYQPQLDAAEQTTVPIQRPNRQQVLKTARKEQQAKKRQEKLEAQQKAKKALEQKMKLEALKVKITQEVEDEIQAEIQAKKNAAQQQITQKRNALERFKAIEQEVKTNLEQEEKRQACRFGARIAGTIEIQKVNKAENERSSKHPAYQVWVSFRPYDYAELSPKDKKQWDQLYPLTIDPLGKNTHPGATYLRKYKVVQTARYQGFAQPLEQGVCNSMMIYSPDLPIDSKQLNLH